MELIFKKQGRSPEIDRLRTERNRILQSHRTSIVGKGKDNERFQVYRPSQRGRKQIERLNKAIYNRFYNTAS